MVVNGLFSRFAGQNPLINAAGMLIAWGASIAVGAFFYSSVESRVRQWCSS